MLPNKEKPKTMIEEFIKSNYCEAIKIQEGFDHDKEMVESIKNKSLSNGMVKDWMRKYGLFQGIKNEIRIKIADEFINFAESKSGRDYKINLEKDFRELHSIFCKIKKRKWLSATSKLLWCINPNDIVIYDAFVERVISVLQCIDKDLAKLPRINYPPKIKDDTNGLLMTKHFINYSNIVKELLRKHQILLDELKKQTNSDYQYDLRILDKLLWIMGDLKSNFKLGEINCKTVNN